MSTIDMRGCSKASIMSRQSFGSNLKAVLSWGNVSKIPTTLFATVAHFFIGIYRLLSLIMAAIKSVPFLIKVAFHFFIGTFLIGYQETWNSIYARIGFPVCQICGKTKRKDSLVKLFDHHDQWVHYNCLMSKETARMLKRRDFGRAAAYMAMSREVKKPLVLKIIVQCLRDMKTPFARNLYKDVARVKNISEKMDTSDILTSLFPWG